MNRMQTNSAQRIRQAASLIEALAALELTRTSQRRKHTLEQAHASLRLHLTKLHLPAPRLSTVYQPQEYLDHARAALEHLARLERLLVSDEKSAFAGLDWRVQPAASAQIDYAAFQQQYGCERQEIAALIGLVQHYYPRKPILNSTVEWAILKQRDMEGQNALGERSALQAEWDRTNRRHMPRTRSQ